MGGCARLRITLLCCLSASAFLQRRGAAGRAGERAAGHRLWTPVGAHRIGAGASVLLAAPNACAGRAYPCDSNIPLAQSPAVTRKRVQVPFTPSSFTAEPAVLPPPPWLQMAAAIGQHAAARLEEQGLLQRFVGERSNPVAEWAGRECCAVLASIRACMRRCAEEPRNAYSCRVCDLPHPTLALASPPLAHHSASRPMPVSSPTESIVKAARDPSADVKAAAARATGRLLLAQVAAGDGAPPPSLPPLVSTALALLGKLGLRVGPGCRCQHGSVGRSRLAALAATAAPAWARTAWQPYCMQLDSVTF